MPVYGKNSTVSAVPATIERLLWLSKKRLIIGGTNMTFYSSTDLRHHNVEPLRRECDHARHELTLVHNGTARS
jgi:hypothetical protein